MSENNPVGLIEAVEQRARELARNDGDEKPDSYHWRQALSEAMKAAEPVGYTSSYAIFAAKEQRDGYAGRPDYLIAWPKITGPNTEPLFAIPTEQLATLQAKFDDLTAEHEEMRRQLDLATQLGKSLEQQRNELRQQLERARVGEMPDYECRACGLEYMQEAGTNGDCPMCGCDGSDESVAAIAAQSGAQQGEMKGANDAT